MDDPPSIPQSEDSNKHESALDLDTVLASMSLSPHSPTHDESPSSPQHLPMTHNSRAILPIEDITADPNAVLGVSKKTSSVYRGTWTKDGEGERVVAIKLLKDTTVDYEHILQRIETFCALSHPNILNIFGLSPFDADPLFVVQEYMDRGCVTQYLKANQGTEAKVDRAQLVLETALGLAYLHSQGVTHGSLKPTNILVNDSGEACIADYGMVEIVPSTCVGAWRYWSPEAWKGITSPASDIYALALSTYEILTSTPPWGVLSESQIFQLVVRESMRPDRPSSEQARRNGLGDGMWRVIERGWAQDAEKRGSAEGWVKGWREGMRERDEVLVDEDAVAGASSGVDMSSGAGSAGSSSGGKNVFGNTRSPPTRKTSVFGHNPNTPSVMRVTNDDPSAPPPPAYEFRATSTSPSPSPVPGSSRPPSGSGTLSPHPASLVPRSASQSPPIAPVPLTFQNRQSTLGFGLGSGSGSNPNLRQSYMSSSSGSGSRVQSYAPSDGKLTINEFGSTPPTSAASFHPQQFQQFQHQQQQQQLGLRNTPSPAPPPLNYADYSAYGDRKNARVMSLQSDPGTNNYNYPHSDTSSVYSSSYGPNRSSYMPSIPGSAPPHALTFQTSGSIREEEGGGGGVIPTSAYGLQAQQERFGAFGVTGQGQMLGVPAGAGYAGSVMMGGSSVARSEIGGMSDVQSSQGGSGEEGARGRPSPNLLAGALQTEVADNRQAEVIDNRLYAIQQYAMQSDKDAQKLITAGLVHTLIKLLKSRAADGVGLDPVLATLGILSVDSLSCNTIYRTNTTTTFIEILSNYCLSSPPLASLSLWCLTRICRTSEIASSLSNTKLLPSGSLPTLLMTQPLLSDSPVLSRYTAWLLGGLVWTDELANMLAALGIVEAMVGHLKKVWRGYSIEGKYDVDDVCAAVYGVARMARSIKLSKALAKAGCVEPLADLLNTSDDPQILLFTSRAIGCLMRPNSSDMSKILLEANCAPGLARIPRVLPSTCVPPLAGFAFAIQRFSCAEWGSGTRKALVEAGVVDSLLAALRTAGEEKGREEYDVHVELALAVSFLGDVGGGAIRKEIVKAGGIDILKRMSVEANKEDMLEVVKACNLAVTSITGNLWSRNAASAKTAMTHNWSGGCPLHFPPCPTF